MELPWVTQSRRRDYPDRKNDTGTIVVGRGDEMHNRKRSSSNTKLQQYCCNRATLKCPVWEGAGGHWSHFYSVYPKKGRRIEHVDITREKCGVALATREREAWASNSGDILLLGYGVQSMMLTDLSATIESYK